MATLYCSYSVHVYSELLCLYNLLVFRFVKNKMYKTCDINMKWQLLTIDRILYNDYTKEGLCLYITVCKGQPTCSILIVAIYRQPGNCEPRTTAINITYSYYRQIMKEQPVVMANCTGRDGRDGMTRYGPTLPTFQNPSFFLSIPNHPLPF